MQYEDANNFERLIGDFRNAVPGEASEEPFELSRATRVSRMRRQNS